MLVGSDRQTDRQTMSLIELSWTAKKTSFLNALTEDEKKTIWLPVVIYSNTDQKETTRLGWTTEWSTAVVVSRDGSVKR